MTKKIYVKNSEGKKSLDEFKDNLRKNFKDTTKMNLGDIVKEYVSMTIQYPKGSILQDVYKERLSNLEEEMAKYKKPDKTYTGLEGNLEQY